jgi:hypothetical protein
MGEVHDLHDAEDQGQATGHNEQHRASGQPVHQQRDERLQIEVHK